MCRKAGEGGGGCVQARERGLVLRGRRGSVTGCGALGLSIEYRRRSCESGRGEWKRTWAHEDAERLHFDAEIEIV